MLQFVTHYMLVCLLLSADVDGRLWRTPLVTDSLLSPSVSSELMSPPLTKDHKHCLAVAAIDAVQLAVIGPANETDSGMLHQLCLCLVSFMWHSISP